MCDDFRKFFEIARRTNRPNFLLFLNTQVSTFCSILLGSRQRSFCRRARVGYFRFTSLSCYISLKLITTWPTANQQCINYFYLLTSVTAIVHDQLLNSIILYLMYESIMENSVINLLVQKFGTALIKIQKISTKLLLKSKYLNSLLTHISPK